MIKIVIKNTVLAVLLALLYSAILLGATGLLSISKSPNIAATTCVLISILSTILFWVVFGFLKYWDIRIVDKYTYVKFGRNSKPDYWEKMLMQKKPVHYKKAIVAHIPIFILALVLLIVLILFFPTINQEIQEINSNRVGYGTGKESTFKFLAILDLLCCSMFTLLFRGSTLIVHFNNLACPHCKNIMSHTNVGWAQSAIVNTEITESYDKYNTVGGVYLNDKRIADIKGKTATYTRTTEHTSVIDKSKIQCQYCGHTMDAIDEDKYNNN